MLVIKNIKWLHKEFDHVNSLIRFFGDELKRCGIMCKIHPVDYNSFSFAEVDKGKFLKSTMDNKIMMNPTDPRIKKLGRSYLVSHRLREDQYNHFMSTVFGTLDLLKLSADVELINKDNSVLAIRCNYEIMNEFPKPKSFPVA